MLPHDLPCSQFKLPPGPKDSLVIITGGLQLHHLHFAYRMQADFPNLVTKWYTVQSTASSSAHVGRLARWRRRIGQAWTERGPVGLGRAIARRLRPASLSETLRRRRELRSIQRTFESEQSETRIFGETVNRLKQQAHLEPTIISSPNEDRVRAELSEIRPYFLVSLGGPLISQPVLDTVRGVPINTHGGWSPDIRGAHATAQALYHRRPDWVGNTIHITTSAADAGPILRRSLVALFDDDSPQDCFFRVVALGNELMSDTIREMLQCESVSVFDQSCTGKTYRSFELNSARRLAIARDFGLGWLAEALAEERAY